MRGWVTVAFACLLLCGCYSSPPYVNPLTAEQLDGLRISEIRFEHLNDGSIDAEKAAKAAGLVRAQLIKRFGAKFTPGSGNAVLVVTLQLLFRSSHHRLGLPFSSDVGIKLSGKIMGVGISAKYHGGHLIVPFAIMPGRLTPPEALLGQLTTPAANTLANSMLCCANGVLSQEAWRMPKALPPQP